MEKLYRHGRAMSTDGPDHAIRPIPPRTVEHARELAARCATYADLCTYPPLLEHDPLELYARVGRRISGAAHAVYGIIRRARQLGFAGALVSHAELGALVGRHERTCRRACELLEPLELLRVVPQYRDGRGPAVELGYDRTRDRNAYALGELAKEPSVLPGKGGSRPPRRARVIDKQSDKTAALSLGRGQTSVEVCPSPSISSSPGVLSRRSARSSEVSTSSTRSATPSPSMPASPAGEQRLPNEKSKVRTSGLATLGEVARFSSSTSSQAARRAHEAAAAAADAGDNVAWLRAMEAAL